jgi:uncharacterized iron-regulated membrane protein
MASVAVGKTRRFRPRVVLQKIHLWAALIVGVFLVLATITGTISMFKNDLNKLFYSHLFKITPSDTPVPVDEAQATAIAAYPDYLLADVYVKEGEPYYFGFLTPEDDYLRAYVDPGTGQVNGIYNPDATPLGWVEHFHESLLADGITFNFSDSTPMWIQNWFGEHLGDVVLKLVSFSFLLMVLTGAYLWWPGIKKLALAFKLRLNKSTYLKHYDWHKILGFISLPFLLMWAVTSLNFFTPFDGAINRLWHTITFTEEVAWEDELFSTVVPDQSMISTAQIKDIVETTTPGARFTGASLATEEDGIIYAWFAHGLDAYVGAPGPGDKYLILDAYSGEVLYNVVEATPSVAADIYANWFFGLHTGVAIPLWGRLIWAVFGLVPLFLAITGVSMWWMKRTKRMSDKVRTPNSVRPLEPATLKEKL